jgi:hypothetical protein
VDSNGFLLGEILPPCELFLENGKKVIFEFSDSQISGFLYKNRQNLIFSFNWVANDVEE